MSWEIFYLICFAGGFLFSVLSFLSGTLSMHLHVPKFMGLGHAGHGTFHGTGGAHVHGPAGHTAASGHHGTAKAATHGGHFSFFNPITTAAFLTWFGGTGYLLVHLRHVWIFTGLVLSTGAGLIGAGIVFWFVAKVLMANERELDPFDYEMVGVLGKVSSSIRSGGTGEIIFSQEGTRRPCAARCETGESLAKGMEVIVTRYERGVAYVKPWQELADSAGIAATHEHTNE